MTRDELLEQLDQTIRVGDTVAKLLLGEEGALLMDRIAIHRNNAVKRICAVDPTDAAAIMQAQLELLFPERFTAWLQAMVTAGDEARMEKELLLRE
ncbi:MAG: hypothetical protein RBS34_13825 [Desulfofustis sp.]|jgi:hypothetical protein|nr:hypothetical protein [Desulfofustis sp.]